MKKIVKIIEDFVKEDRNVVPFVNFLRYVGPGILVTVGFIDPGNWATNVSAGSMYGYKLLWVITLSTVMLIILQHNAAHLGIVTGYCLSEATSIFINNKLSKIILTSAVIASISTSTAELLGTAIALNMLFKIPIKIGAALSALVIFFVLYSNSYKRLEKIIIGFVSLIGLSFLFEVYLVNINWRTAALSWVIPVIPHNSIVIIMSVLGAVVMPHNLFLHSEIIQSRQWNLQDESVVKKQLKYEFLDTLFSMLIGWAINSAMVLLSAATFYEKGIVVDRLEQAGELLKPIVGSGASIVFAIALLFSGFSSTVTSGMAGGSIFAGIFKEPYNIKDKHTRAGIFISLITALVVIFLVKDSFRVLILSQMILSIQLPITVFTQVYLTSSKRVMKGYANGRFSKAILIFLAIIITVLNVKLLMDTIL
ncbi:Mg2+/Co2+ transporter [Thermoanaerobacterium thermosaccharolyticum]|uniref:Mg2+/Co2+ transporter n=1 Tax=Thermoanaerobacterium thermosaccharolyticum TaxID=1517 RepID=A0A231VKK9_THETR|nr:Nramp family divalent metal transporter [Thermoanaerobacterium thermosaccharolyticum]OXT08785.1 Mg2+/Co2+ transporter [Thermoanaerobacterium thermosaccharolyticum]PHO06844.1 Mg2+/Co2+ transporter [Thermoanaerobacterium thermosaccharolyticum]WHE06655.1 Nramp family divalent metal transporter [Thermoanaerobacterium thermosaccharolyticum]